MTKGAITNRHAIDSLAASLIDDVLNMSDEELLAELQADSEDVKISSQMADDTLNRARATCGKAKLAAAKKAVFADKQRIPTKTCLNPDQARRRLKEALDNYPESHGRLTLAARKSEGLSDNDLLILLDGLDELGITSQVGKKDGED